MRAFGINDLIVCYKHMLPNAIGFIIVNITLGTAMFILDEAAFELLGLGVPLEIATWGETSLMLARDLYTPSRCWWIWLPVRVS